VVFLHQIKVFFQQNTTASLLERYFNDSMQTVYARSGGSQQREVADGADVVFTDTVVSVLLCHVKKFILKRFITSRTNQTIIFNAEFNTKFQTGSSMHVRVKHDLPETEYGRVPMLSGYNRGRRWGAKFFNAV